MVTFFSLVMLPLLTGVCSPQSKSCPTPTQQATWDSVVRPYLKQPLWRSSTAYDAGHILMVPVHAAFVLGDSAWESDLADHFRAFASRGAEPRLRPDERLARSQYLFLAAEFIAMAAGHHRADLIPDGLVADVTSELRDAWLADTVSIQGRRFVGGLSARLQWKLSHAGSHPANLAAVDDRDRYAFATGSDLVAYTREVEHRAPERWLQDLLDQAWTALHARVAPTGGGGWVFQPGIWADHKDYAFAGVTDTLGVTGPRPRPRVTEDASHSFRWPALLQALRRGAAGDTSRQAYYESLIRGLDVQFFTEVLVRPDAAFPGYRLNNYMDGWNGLYRWSTTGPRTGVGPYGLSGSLTMGWWALLGTVRSHELYRQLAGRFPLDPRVEQMYARNAPEAGGGVVRNSYQNGLRQLLVELAACLPVTDTATGH